MEATMPQIKIPDKDKISGNAIATSMGIPLGAPEATSSPIVQIENQPVEITTEGKSMPTLPATSDRPKSFFQNVKNWLRAS